MISLYKIAEQCKIILDNRATLQAIIEDVKNAYSACAKKQWYENTAQDSYELNGSFIYTFPPVTPEFDCDRDMYFVKMPSTYLELPHEIGVNWVSFVQDRQSFVRVQNWGIFANLKSACMGGRYVYEINNDTMWLPNMKPSNVGPILMKLAIALDDVEPTEKLNIAPNMVQDIIALVVGRYMPVQDPTTKVREVIN